MAQFKYVGDPNDRFSGPNVINQYGQVFVKGETVDMPDKTDEEKAHVKKLQTNSHFVDLSDKDGAAGIAERQKAQEKLDADKAKAVEEQRKRDEADEKKMLANQAKLGPPVVENTLRPPGTITRDPAPDAFGGRTVEERTQAEDHTKAGKTKG